VDLVAAMGFEGQAFERAEDFLQSHQVASPDCLITDVRMPGMNGLEPLERLLASVKSIPAAVALWALEPSAVQALRVRKRRAFNLSGRRTR